MKFNKEFIRDKNYRERINSLLEQICQLKKANAYLNYIANPHLIKELEKIYNENFVRYNNDYKSNKDKYDELIKQVTSNKDNVTAKYYDSLLEISKRIEQKLLIDDYKINATAEKDIRCFDSTLKEAIGNYKSISHSYNYLKEELDKNKKGMWIEDFNIISNSIEPKFADMKIHGENQSNRFYYSVITDAIKKKKDNIFNTILPPKKQSELYIEFGKKYLDIICSYEDFKKDYEEFVVIQNKRGKNKLLKVLLFIIVVASIYPIISGFKSFNEWREWKDVLNKNTYDGFVEYLKTGQYGSPRYYSWEAIGEIESILLNHPERLVGNVKDYKNFLTNYHSPQRDLILKVYDDLLYNEININPKIELYEDYIRFFWKEGKHIVRVRNEFEGFLYKEAINNDSLDLMEAYKSYFPSGRHKNKIIQNIIAILKKKLDREPSAFVAMSLFKYTKDMSYCPQIVKDGNHNQIESMNIIFKYYYLVGKWSLNDGSEYVFLEIWLSNGCEKSEIRFEMAGEGTKVAFIEFDKKYNLFKISVGYTKKPDRNDQRNRYRSHKDYFSAEKNFLITSISQNNMMITEIDGDELKESYNLKKK